MTRILCIALSPAVDIWGEAPTVRPTRKIRTAGTTYDPGGGGINVARVISRFGGNVKVIYLSGGEVGKLLDRMLTQEGVKAYRIETGGQSRIGFVVHELTTGLEYRFVTEGAEIGPEHLTACGNFIASGSWDFIVASGSLPRGAPDETFVQLASIAAAQGARFVLDTSGNGLRAALTHARVFLVKPSREELEHYVGTELDEDGISHAAAGIVASGAAQLVAASLGAEGALLASSEGILRLPAIPVKVRSSVGAGDSFLGGMTWALSQGRSNEESFRFGLAAGAASLKSPGTKLCQPNDVYRLLNLTQSSTVGS